MGCGGRSPVTTTRLADCGGLPPPPPPLFGTLMHLTSRLLSAALPPKRGETSVRTNRAVVLSVDPRAAGITQHHSVIIALCTPATAMATTRTLHCPSNSSRRRRGNPWSQVSRRPPATTHPLQKTDSIDRLPRSADHRRAWRTRSACCASVWTQFLYRASASESNVV